MRVQLWPQSLFGRLLSALLAAIGVTLVVIVVLIIRERRELSFWGSETAEIVELLEATAGSLAELPPAARAEEIERLRTSALVVDRDAEQRRPPPPQPNLAASAAALRARLARQLPPGFEVSVQPADRAASAVIRVGRARPEPFRGGPGGPGGGPGGGRGGPGGGPGGPGGPGGGRVAPVEGRVARGVNSTWRSRCPTAT